MSSAASAAMSVPTAMSTAVMAATMSAAMVLTRDQLTEKGLPASGDDDMVIADRAAEEIIPGRGRIVELQDDLAAA